ncbi:hypothetical protein [Planobispora rosea]|uniref:hypothetical protein n=1 Tax=Planobispora rosea TaxID=35762 RepID=UPI00114CA625|nr:hypothetical protein [Planobispora rosea]
MTAKEVKSPVYELRCDQDRCNATFITPSAWAQRWASTTRAEARAAGWDVPPPRGKGSRSPRDYCPVHAHR